MPHGKRKSEGLCYGARGSGGGLAIEDSRFKRTRRFKIWISWVRDLRFKTEAKALHQDLGLKIEIHENSRKRNQAGMESGGRESGNL